MRQLLLLVLAATSVAFADSPRLVSAAREQTRHVVAYDGSCTRIDYPMGDVSADRGVRTDVGPGVQAHEAITDVYKPIHVAPKVA